MAEALDPANRPDTQMSTTERRMWDKDAADALRIVQQLREYHHKALWEEEKHFTWLHSIIFAAQVAVATRDASELEARGLILIVLGVIGLLFALVAIRVVRREGRFFVDAHRLYVAQHNSLFPDFKRKEPGLPSNPGFWQLVFTVVRPAATIRDNFQFVFVVFAAIDLVLLAAVSLGAI